MARLSPTAQRQIDGLARHYIQIDRIEALGRLRDAVARALDAVDRPILFSRPLPAAYRALGSRQMSWIKIHVYWFGFGRAADGVMTIANVIWDQSNIPQRIRPFDDTP